MQDALESMFEVEEVEIDPPSGNFQMVNKCGLTGTARATELPQISRLFKRTLLHPHPQHAYGAFRREDRDSP